MNVSRRYLRRLERAVNDQAGAIIALQELIKQLYANQGALDKKVNQAYALARSCAKVLIDTEIEEADYIVALAAEMEHILNNPPKQCYTPKEQMGEGAPENPPEKPKIQRDGKIIQFPVKPQETNP